VQVWGLPIAFWLAPEAREESSDLCDGESCFDIGNQRCEPRWFADYTETDLAAKPMKVCGLRSDKPTSIHVVKE